MKLMYTKYRNFLAHQPEISFNSSTLDAAIYDLEMYYDNLEAQVEGLSGDTFEGFLTNPFLLSPLLF